MTVGIEAAREHQISNDPREVNGEANFRMLGTQRHIELAPQPSDLLPEREIGGIEISFLLENSQAK